MRKKQRVSPRFHRAKINSRRKAQDVIQNKQITMSTIRDEPATVRTKKKEFLDQTDLIVPWGEWLAIIQPCYYKGEHGNKPSDLSDMATVAEVMNSRAFSEF